MESSDKNQIEFIRQMTGIGMSENEAKAYYAVFMLKSATVRDVYEISGIPRNKIYQVLSSNMFTRVTPVITSRIPMP